MHWTYGDLLALPAEVYTVLIDHLRDQARALDPTGTE
jgi:hypothetical protein